MTHPWRTAWVAAALVAGQLASAPAQSAPASLLPPEATAGRVLAGPQPWQVPAVRESGARWTAAGRGGDPAGGGGRKDSRWRPALAAAVTLAVAGAAAAYWSNDRADEAYQRYLASAGKRRQDEALARAERYDRMAGAAFAGMEAGLVLTAYLVFF